MVGGLGLTGGLGLVGGLAGVALIGGLVGLAGLLGVAGMLAGGRIMGSLGRFTWFSRAATLKVVKVKVRILLLTFSSNPSCVPELCDWFGACRLILLGDMGANPRTNLLAVLGLFLARLRRNLPALSAAGGRLLLLKVLNLIGLKFLLLTLRTVGLKGMGLNVDLVLGLVVPRVLI